MKLVLIDTALVKDYPSLSRGLLPSGWSNLNSNSSQFVSQV